MLKIGDTAPCFTAITHRGEKLELASLLGSKAIVLYFYPRDFTFGCVREACGFRDNIDLIEKEDAIVVGVSPDSLESHQRFAKALEIPYLLISDPDGVISGLYDVKRWLLPTKRVTYLIDKSGKIQGVFHHEFAIGKHHSHVVSALQIK